MNDRKVQYKQMVLKHYPKAVAVKDGVTFKVLSKERTGKRILGRGNTAWQAWKDSAESNSNPKRVVPKIKPDDTSHVRVGGEILDGYEPELYLVETNIETKPMTQDDFARLVEEEKKHMNTQKPDLTEQLIEEDTPVEQEASKLWIVFAVLAILFVLGVLWFGGRQ